MVEKKKSKKGIKKTSSGNKHPVMATPDNPYLTQNRYKAIEKEHPDKVSQALSNVMTFAGEFKADDFRKGVRRFNNDLDDVANRLNNYFKTCEETGQLPTIEKMYLSLNIHRHMFSDWIRDGSYPEAVQMINKAKDIIASMDAELAANGTLQPVVYIFRAKNFYGMRDQVDIQATTANPLGEEKQVLEDKYKDIVDVKIKEPKQLKDSITQKIEDKVLENTEMKK